MNLIFGLLDFNKYKRSSQFITDLERNSSFNTQASHKGRTKTQMSSYPAT